MKQALLATLLLSAGLSARIEAQEARFEAYADAKQVVENGYFRLTFTLTNGEGKDFNPPAFDDFRVLAGPSRSMSTTIVNGKVSKELSYTYTLKPLRKGTFTIGPATIGVEGKILRTETLRVEVVEGRDREGDAPREYYVRAIPIPDTAYIGQQISLDYRLYTNINIESYNILEEANYQGFYADDLERYNTRVQREVIDGVQYITKVLKRVALFPQQAGSLTIDPMQLQLGVIAKGEEEDEDAFFFNRRIERLLAATDPVSIAVLSLPRDTTGTFSGAVGRFRMDPSLGRREFTTNDVISLRVKITGDGDMKRVRPPKLDFPEQFEVYEPRIFNERTFERDGRLVSEKIFEFLALPTIPGAYELSPEFTYFDPDSSRYIRLRPEVFSISVSPGKNRDSNLPLAGAEEPREDISYLKLNTRLKRERHHFTGSPLYWSLAALPFLLFASVLIGRRIQGREQRLSPEMRRQRQARQVAQQRLNKARRYLEEQQSRAFYDEVSKAMLGYVSDKLQISRAYLSKDEVRRQLEKNNVPSATTDRFLSIMQNCEMALFAGKDNAAAMEETYQNAVEVLAAIEMR